MRIPSDEMMAKWIECQDVLAVKVEALLQERCGSLLPSSVYRGWLQPGDNHVFHRRNDIAVATAATESSNIIYPIYISV